jgi:Na+/H+ antiporter NhaC
VNSFIVFPAALIVAVCYLLMGDLVAPPDKMIQVEWIKVIPYLVVLITAILGMNVMAVLTLGILLTGMIGILTGSIDLYGWFGSMGKGILSMGELIIVTMMAGGMLELIRQQGGIDFIIRLLTRHVSNKRGAELSIAVLVSLVNVCTANNTVAILTVGDISKRIGDRFGVDNRKCASILDTFSCTVQGMLPYGAQLLIAAGLASLNPVSIIPYLYYPFVLGVVALLSILLRYPRRYS